MKSLASFISEGPEEKKLDKLRVLVVSSGALRSSEAAQRVLAKKEGEPPIFHTARRFKEESKKLNHEVFITNPGKIITINTPINISPNHI